MAGGLSIHAWDVSRGIAAAGLRVEVKGPDGRTLADKPVDSRGVLELAEVPAAGLYEAVSMSATGTGRRA